MAELSMPDREPAAHDQRSVAVGGSALAFKIITLLGALLMIIGALSPWGYVWNNGYESPQYALQGNEDGVYALTIGLVVGCLGIVRLVTKVHGIVLWIQLAVSGYLIWGALTDMNSAMSAAYQVELGPGVWMTLMGAIVGAVGSFPVLLALSPLLVPTALFEGQPRKWRPISIAVVVAVVVGCFAWAIPAKNEPPAPVPATNTSTALSVGDFVNAWWMNGGSQRWNLVHQDYENYVGSLAKHDRTRMSSACSGLLQHLRDLQDYGTYPATEVQGDYAEGFSASIEGADDCSQATQNNDVPLLNQAMNEIAFGFQHFANTRALGGQRGLN